MTQKTTEIKEIHALIDQWSQENEGHRGVFAVFVDGSAISTLISGKGACVAKGLANLLAIEPEDDEDLANLLRVAEFAASKIKFERAKEKKKSE